MSKTKNEYKRIFAGIGLCYLICLICMGMPASAEAKEKTADAPGIACKSGRYIYFACNTNNKHKSGIMRYDTKSGKKKLIADNWVSGRLGNGFYNLSIKGKYIYATWNRGDGPYTDATYIYRFSKDGKKKKKIAVGRSPVVAGKYLYYIEGKIAGGNTIDTGNVCRVKLNGKGKKKVIKKKGEWFFRKLYSYGNTLLYSSYDSEESLFTKKGKEKVMADMRICDNNAYRDNRYEYYSNETDVEPANTIYRKDLRDGSVEIVAQYEKGLTFRVCGKYIIIQTVEKHKSVIYCMDTDSGKKKRLAKWTPAD